MANMIQTGSSESMLYINFERQLTHHTAVSLLYLASEKTFRELMENITAEVDVEVDLVSPLCMQGMGQLASGVQHLLQNIFETANGMHEPPLFHPDRFVDFIRDVCSIAVSIAENSQRKEGPKRNGNSGIHPPPQSPG